MRVMLWGREIGMLKVRQEARNQESGNGPSTMTDSTSG